MTVDGIGANKWIVVDDVGLDQPGWLSGWLADCPEWSGAGSCEHARLANTGNDRFEGSVLENGCEALSTWPLWALHDGARVRWAG